MIDMSHFATHWTSQLVCEILFLRHEIEKGLRLAVYRPPSTALQCTIIQSY